MAGNECQRKGIDASIGEIDMQGIGEAIACYRIGVGTWVWSWVWSVALLVENVAFIRSSTVAASVGSQHVRAAATVPIVIGIQGTLHAERAVAAGDIVPVLRLVAKRLGSQIHILVVLVFSVIGKDQELACCLVADGVARAGVCQHPVGIGGLLAPIGNEVDVGIDIVVLSQAEIAFQRRIRDVIDAICYGSICVERCRTKDQARKDTQQDGV